MARELLGRGRRMQSPVPFQRHPSVCSDRDLPHEGSAYAREGLAPGHQYPTTHSRHSHLRRTMPIAPRRAVRGASKQPGSYGSATA